MKLQTFAIAYMATTAPASALQSDAEIRKQIIKDSIESYSGGCPCPYTKDRAGRSCGARSAYSRPGGDAPICYATDVTQRDIDAWRKRNG